MKSITSYPPRSLLAILLLVAVSVLTAVSLFRIITTSAPDFSVFYQATNDLKQHINPYQDHTLYTAFAYPPVTSVLYLPLLLLNYPTAQAVFVLLSAGSVYLIIYLSLRLAFPAFSLKYFSIFTSLTLLSFPTKFTLGMGQSNLVGYCLLLLGFCLYMRERHIKGGFFLGLAITIKPIIGFMLLFFMLRRAWRTVVAAMASILTISLFAGIIFGFETYVYYISSIIPNLLNPDGREVYYNQGAMGFVARLTESAVFRQITSLLISLVIISILIYFVLNNRVGRKYQFALFLAALPLVNTLSWQHHFVLLIFPFILTAALIPNAGKQRIAFLVGLITAYILVSVNIKTPSQLVSWPQILLLSHVFYGAIILLSMLLGIARREFREDED